MIIKNREELLSLGDSEGREMVLDMIEAGLRQVDPYLSTRRLVRLEGERLLVGGQPGMDVSGYGDEVIDLSGAGRIYVVGAGKAIQRQAKALEDILGDRLAGGAITVKKGEGCQLSRIHVTEAAHPVPDENSLAGARRILEIARSARQGDLVITLFGSGCSSLFVLPAPGIELEDVQAVYRLAIKYGHQTLVHRVMPYFSLVSSGRILTEIHPARSINFLTALARYPRWHGAMPADGSWVSSWPPGPRRIELAFDELRAERWWDELPPSMRRILEKRDPSYEVPDLDLFRRMDASFWQPVDSHLMLEGAKRRAEELGLRGMILGSWDWMPCEETAKLLSGIVKEIVTYGNPADPPVALISGGELVVPVGTARGIGGRNQEFALSSAMMLEGSGQARFVIGAVDSDGTDGPGTQLAEGGAGDPHCLAGGIVDSRTVASARQIGIDLAEELREHNSSPPLMRLASGVFTGNTGMCAGDLRVMLVLGKSTRRAN